MVETQAANFESSDMLRVFPTFVWKAQVASGVRQGIEDDVLAKLDEMRRDAGAPAPGTLRDALNAHLRPRLVSVLTAETVSEDFDARRSATARIYRYRIVNRRAPLSLDAKRAWQISRALDAEAVHQPGDGARELREREAMENRPHQRDPQ